MSDKVKELLAELQKNIEEVKSSEEFQEMLECFSQFHDYSYHNSLLIKMQKPDATRVAGYRQWQEKFDRHVKKGEEGIAILAPFRYTTTKVVTEEVVIDGKTVEEEVEKEVEKIHFRPVYVFDISQTEGEPLPELDLSVNDIRSDLLKPCLDFARDNNISVDFKKLIRDEEGYARGNNIVIASSLNDTKKASVLLHELAHVLLHQRNFENTTGLSTSSEEESSDGGKLTKEIKELEAESIAYVVMHHFGVDIKSHRYLSLYRKSYDLAQSLSRIKSVSGKIISFIEKELQK